MISINDFHVTYTPGSGYSAKFKDGTAPNVSICWGEEYVKKLKENLNKPAAGGNDPSFERAELTEEELASLAEKFDPHKMTQKEYDECLETLVDKNVITKQEMQRAGYKGLVVVNSWSDMCYGQLTDCTGMSVEQIFGMKSNIHLFGVGGMDGDALSWSNVMNLRFPGEKDGDGVYHALHNILSSMADY